MRAFLEVMRSLKDDNFSGSMSGELYGHAPAMTVPSSRGE